MTETPTIQSGPHWSESLVEHLRTVHFALSIVGVAVIVTLSVGTEYDAQKALAQALEIRDFIQKWQTDMTQLYDNLLAEQWKSFPRRIGLGLARDQPIFFKIENAFFDVTKETLMSMSQRQSVVVADRRPASIASLRSW
jgi:hypothetical protein